ncbi:insulinase family protein [Halomonas huangheensis]|uniref:Protease 3 n=2 Tax=Halomonas huangheensis TaxID=1178482 RepID=W1N9L1_9GAMM|nr:insulinase family protein [Halomonas huangheensis]ERL52198.1 hypothetical protein BJB45_09540 [Halomonas huangheensis]
MATTPRRRGRVLLVTLCALTLPWQAAGILAAETSDQAIPAEVADVTTPIVSPHDQRDYRVLTLDNGLEVLLVSDPEADKAAASMNVAVGSSQDPDDLQGLAHLLEHMLFLGTDAWPEPDAYQGYISRHGGNHNAFTASRDTNYFFDIEPNALEGALDRFSHFFIDPLFNADQLGSERTVVNSEYQARLRDDSRRENEVLDALLNPENPTVGFSVGSTETLADRPEGEPSLRDRVMQFYEQHYGAGVMHLSVVAPLPLDQLTRMVSEDFSAIPNRDLERASITTPLVETDRLPMAAEVQSLRDERHVTFMFPIEDPILSYRTKPDSYIANLLGHEGPGSLLSELRKEGWADGLSAGTARSDGQHALFSVDISLTPEGAKHIDRIQASLFAAIKQIREDGVSESRYDEQASLADQSFQFQQHGSPIDEVTRLSMNLAYYPLKDVNRAAYRMDGLDRDEAEQWLDALRPERLLRLYSGPDVDSEQRTRYYDTAWRKVPLKANEAQPVSGLALPAPNPFIAEDLALLDQHQDIPTVLLDSPQADIWYKADSEFDTPRVSWRISLQHPESSQSARQAAMARLLAGWLNDSLNDQLYAARLAGQSYTAYAHSRGMTLSFTGWRDRQSLVMQQVIDQLLNGEIEASNLERVRYGLKRQWSNTPRDPLYYQAQRTLSEALIRPQWSTPVLLEALDDISLDDLRNYRDDFLSQLHVQALAVGNLDKDLANDEAQQVIDKLQPQLSADDIPDLVVLDANDLPALTPESTREESILLRYLQGSDQSVTTQARLAVLGKLLETPFYQRLRTEQQLGYVVNAGYSPLLYAPGISMLVQSPATPSAELRQHVDAFLNGVPQMLSNLDDEDLTTYRQAVHDELLVRDTSLPERTSRLWGALSWGDLQFDHHQRLAAAVLEVNASDLSNAWGDLLGHDVVDVTFDPGASPSDVAGLKAGLEVLPGDSNANSTSDAPHSEIPAANLKDATGSDTH